MPPTEMELFSLCLYALEQVKVAMSICCKKKEEVAMSITTCLQSEVSSHATRHAIVRLVNRVLYLSLVSSFVHHPAIKDSSDRNSFDMELVFFLILATVALSFVFGN